jgi:hypothetical protein
VQDPRERVLRRVEVEARAFADSDGTTSQLRLGRVQGLLEAGVLAGYWRKRDSAAAAELVQHRYRLSKVRGVLLRGDEVKLWKVTDIAEFLGVSTQRVDQLALAGRFPATGGPGMAVAGDTGDRRMGSPRWKHPGVPRARGRHTRSPSFETWDGTSKLYGWPQTFVTVL